MLSRCWLGDIWPVKNWVGGAGVVICLEQGADLHMAQLMPLSLTVSCSSKIQISFTFLIPANPRSPGKRAVKRVCVCVVPTAWTFSNQFELWPPQLHQHHDPSSLYWTENIKSFLEVDFFTSQIKLRWLGTVCTLYSRSIAHFFLGFTGLCKVASIFVVFKKM